MPLPSTRKSCCIVCATAPSSATGCAADLLLLTTTPAAAGACVGSTDAALAAKPLRRGRRLPVLRSGVRACWWICLFGRLPAKARGPLFAIIAFIAPRRCERLCLTGGQAPCSQRLTCLQAKKGNVSSRSATHLRGQRRRRRQQRQKNSSAAKQHAGKRRARPTSRDFCGSVNSVVDKLQPAHLEENGVFLVPHPSRPLHRHQSSCAFASPAGIHDCRARERALLF